MFESVYAWMHAHTEVSFNEIKDEKHRLFVTLLKSFFSSKYGIINSQK